MISGPDFICIGAPKSGTTWLYQNLNRHPSIWLPPVKELHYFDALYPLPRYAIRKSHPRGIFGLGRRYSRRKILHVFYRVARKGSFNELIWAYRYFSGSPDESWYMSLFEGHDDVLTGDLTTDYCALSEEAVSKVKSMLPDIKIVYLMRNPVERAWSHAKMLLPSLLDKPYVHITDVEFINYLSHPAPQLRGNYPRTIKIWERIFGRQQLFLGFFDEVVNCPRDLYIRLLNYLDVSADEKYIPEGLLRKVNVSKVTGNHGMPDPVRECLIEQYRHDMEWLAGRFGGYASKWLDELI
jgi:hypothetical protein